PSAWQALADSGRWLRRGSFAAATAALLRRSDRSGRRVGRSRVQQRHAQTMPRKSPILRPVVPAQCQHVGMLIDDNRFVPAVFQALLGNHNIAWRDLVPTRRQPAVATFTPLRRIT